MASQPTDALTLWGQELAGMRPAGLQTIRLDANECLLILFTTSLLRVGPLLAAGPRSMATCTVTSRLSAVPAGSSGRDPRSVTGLRRFGQGCRRPGDQSPRISSLCPALADHAHPAAAEGATTFGWYPQAGQHPLRGRDLPVTRQRRRWCRCHPGLHRGIQGRPHRPRQRLRTLVERGPGSGAGSGLADAAQGNYTASASESDPVVAGDKDLAAFRQALSVACALQLVQEAGGRLLIQLPVGIGKTQWMARIIVEALTTTSGYDLVIVLVPRRDLFEERS